MTAWTVEAIAARRAEGGKLVTAGDWSCSTMTSTGGGATARLSLIRYAPQPNPRMVVAERDPRDGEVFPTSEDAEAYALNAGRLQWYIPRS